MRLQCLDVGACPATPTRTSARGHGRKAAGLVSAFLLLAVVLGQGLFTNSATAAPCKCVSDKVTELAKAAEVVFVGTVQTGETKRQDVTYTLEVSRIYKGQVPGTEVQVMTSLQTSACGLGPLPKGGKVVIFAEAGAPMKTTTCAGSGKATPERMGKVENALGEGQVPQTPPAEKPDPSPPPKATRTPLPASEAAALPRLLVPAGVLVLAGLGGLAASAWLSRRA